MTQIARKRIGETGGQGKLPCIGFFVGESCGHGSDKVLVIISCSQSVPGLVEWLEPPSLKRVASRSATYAGLYQ